MTLAAPPAGIHIGPSTEPELTLGWKVLGWTADYLLQPDGPNAGEPWRFTREQMLFVLNWYAIDREGRFLNRSGMLRRCKGHGKDPLGAALCCVEFVGPCRFAGWKDGEPVAEPSYAAWIQTAAVSKDQTRNTMTLFPGMLSPKAQREYGIDIGKEIVYAHRGRCRIEAVTSSPRALEGGRPTFVLKNETHHWLTANEGLEMSAVIARNAAKTGARVLAISNAHNPGEGSDAERDYDTWQKIEAGQTRASGFLYDSLEAPPGVDLSDPDSLRSGILAARGDSVWIDPDRIMEEIYDPRTAPSTARRFYLNQIIAAEDAWLAPHEWDACADAGNAIELGDQITLGFDGSKSDDNTALMGCRVSDSHLFPLGIWDPEDHGGLVPADEVDAAVEKAFTDYDVVGAYCDLQFWETYIAKWQQDHAETLCARASERRPMEWDMRGHKLETTKAAEAYHDAIVERDLTHSGDPRVNQHHYNARRWPNNYGVTFRKESPFSPRKIDAVAAAMLARKARQDYLALPENKRRDAGPSVYETERLFIL